MLDAINVSHSINQNFLDNVCEKISSYTWKLCALAKWFVEQKTMLFFSGIDFRAEPVILKSLHQTSKNQLMVTDL